MTTDAAPADPGGLQFDRVEAPAAGDAGPPACAACGAPLQTEYYSINGKTVCSACREGLVAAFTGGSGAARFFRALAAGLAGGALGAGIYYAVLAISGYEVGLVAIAVGFLVGGAVRWGCGHRGGWLYQLMAVAITYSAIVSTYMPGVLKLIRETRQEEKAVAAKYPADPPDRKAMDGAEESNKGGILRTAVAGLFLFILACAWPFLTLPGNILGVLIIGFGVYQAWAMNRRPELRITGPHSLAPAAPS